MELYRLKSFLAIAKKQNLTRSAEQLNISQSALSSQLRQLEEELGLSLFDRSSRGMHLTDYGRELLPLVESLLEAEGKLLQKAALLRHGGGELLQIGLNADPGFLRAGAINRRMQQLYSGMSIVYLSSPTARAAQLLRQGQLDLAFLYGQLNETDICSQVLADVRFCVVIPNCFVPASEELAWADVAALPWIWVEQGSLPYDALLQEFARFQLTPRQAVKAVDEYIVKELVLDRQGLAVMREDEARPLVDAGKASIWRKGWLSLPLSLAWSARSEGVLQVRTARDVIFYLWRDEVRLAADGNEINY